MNKDYNTKIASKFDLLINKSEKNVEISLKISATGSTIPLIDDSKRPDPHNFYEGFCILKDKFKTVQVSPCENYLMVKSGKSNEYKLLHTWRVFWIDYQEEKTHLLNAFFLDNEDNSDVEFNSDIRFNRDSNIIETNTINYFPEYLETINVHFIDKNFDVVKSSLLFTQTKIPNQQKMKNNRKVLI